MIKQILKNNRSHWFFGLVWFWFWSYLILFGTSIGLGHSAVTLGTSTVYIIGLGLFSCRLLIGFIFGENKKKVIIYLFMPFVTAFVSLAVVGYIMRQGH